MKLLILFAFLPLVYADFDHTYIDAGSTFSITYDGKLYALQIVPDHCPAGQSVAGHEDFVGNYAEQENFCLAIYAQSGFAAEGGQFHYPSTTTNPDPTISTTGGWQPGGCWADGRSGQHGNMVSVAGANANPQYTGVGWVHNYCIMTLCPNDFTCHVGFHLKSDYLTTSCATSTCENTDCCDASTTCASINDGSACDTGYVFDTTTTTDYCASDTCTSAECCKVGVCAENERVLNNVCEPCAAGSLNEAGDLATGGNTDCFPQKCNDIDGAGTSFLQSGCDAGLFLLPDLNVACPVEGSRRRLTSHIPTGISDFTPGSVHVYLHPTLCAYIPSGYGGGGYGGNTPKASYYKVVSTSVDSNGVDQIVIGQCACVKTLDMGEEWNPDTDTCLGENDPNWQLTYTLADLITLTTDGYNELCNVSCGTDYQYFSYSTTDYSSCDEMRASEPMCGGTPAPPATYTEQNWGYCLDYDTRPVVSSADMSQFNDIVLYDGSEAAELGEAWKLTGVTYTQSEAVDAFKAICSALGDKCGAFITLKDASDANNIFSGWVAKFYVSNDCDDPEEIDVFTFFQKDGHVAPPAFGCTSSSCCAEVTCDSNFVCNSGTHLKDDLTGSCASGTCTNSDCCEINPACTNSFSCSAGTHLKDTLGTCASETCVNNDCCDPNPSCTQSGFTCGAGFHDKDMLTTPCASGTCDSNDCCDPNPTCDNTNGQGTGFLFSLCGAGQSLVPNMGITCAGASCTQSDCCENNPTCSQSFTCSAGTHLKDDLTAPCDTLTCDNNDCCEANPTCDSGFTCSTGYTLTTDFTTPCSGATCQEHECCDAIPYFDAAPDIENFAVGSVHVHMHSSVCEDSNNNLRASYYKVVSVDGNTLTIGHCQCAVDDTAGLDTCDYTNSILGTYTLEEAYSKENTAYQEICESYGTGVQYFGYADTDYATYAEMAAASACPDISDFAVGSVHAHIHPTLCHDQPGGYGSPWVPQASYWKVVAVSNLDIIIGHCRCADLPLAGLDTCDYTNPNMILGKYSMWTANYAEMTANAEICRSCGSGLQYTGHADTDYATCDDMEASEPRCGGTPATCDNSFTCDAGTHLKDSFTGTCFQNPCGNSDCCEANPTCNNVNGQGTPFSPLSCGAGLTITSTMTTVCATDSCTESDCCEDILCGPNYLCLSGVLNANGNCQTSMCSQTECCIEDQTCSQAAHQCPGGQTLVDDNICPGGACTDLLCCVMPAPPIGGGGAPVCSLNFDQASCCAQSGCAFSNNDCISIFELSGNTDQCTVKFQPADLGELKIQVDTCLAADASGVNCCFNSQGFVSVEPNCPSGQYKMNDIDTSQVTALTQLFKDQASFNADISGWDVSAVTNFEEVFRNTGAFSQDLSCWDVDQATTLGFMFYAAAGMPAQQPLCWDVSGTTYTGGIGHTIHSSFATCSQNYPCLNCPNLQQQQACMGANLCAWTNNGCFVGQADATCTPLTADYAACLANPDCGYNMLGGAPNCIGATSVGGLPCPTHDGDEAACCAQAGCAWATGNDCIDETALAGNPNLCNAAPSPAAPAAPSPAAPAPGTSGIVIPPPSPAPAPDAPAPAPATPAAPAPAPVAPTPATPAPAPVVFNPDPTPGVSITVPSPSSTTDCTQFGAETGCMNAGCAWNNIGCFATESRPACDLLTGDIGCLDYNNCGLTMSGGIVICTGSAAIQSPPPTASSTDGACASSPCQNGGVCSDDGNGGFSCACDQWNSGWTGATCETDFMECAFFHRNDCPNYRIQQNGADVPCTNSGDCTAIEPSKCYQGFCSAFTYECNDFGGGYSCDCGAGYVGDGYTCRDVTAPCLENEYVLNNLCTPCPTGTENMAGEDPTGDDTSCSPIPCTAVVTYGELTNLTIGCMFGSATGTYGDCGCSCTADGFSGFFCNECALGHGFTGSECVPCVAPKASDTTLYSESCHAQTCGVDKRLVSNFNTSSLDEAVNCEDCPPGMESNASSLICTDILCAENELVSGNTCVACPGVQTNPAGDVASGGDTTCQCPPGTTPGAGDVCDPIICGTDYYVSDHVCTLCPTGLVNLAGDDASGANTTCVAPCDVDYYVASNVCTECPEGFGWYGGDNPEGPDTPVAFPNPPGPNTICYNDTMCGDRQFGKVYCEPEFTTNCTADRCVCIEGKTGETCSRDEMTTEEIQNLEDTFGSDFIVSDAEVDAFHDDLRLHILDVTTAESRKPNAVVKDVVLQNAVTLKNLNTYQKILADGRTAMFAVAPDLHVTDTCVADPTTCTSLDLNDVPDNTVVFLQTGNRNGAYSVLSKGAVLITRQRQYTPADTYYMRCFDNDAGVWQPATLHDIGDLYMCNGFAILIGSQVAMCEPTVGDDIGTCGEHGACAIDGMSVYCDCDDGWSGDHCEIPFTVPSHCHQFDCDDYGGHAGDISIPAGTAQSALVGLCCTHSTMADFDAACDAATDRETHFDLGCCHRTHCI